MQKQGRRVQDSLAVANDLATETISSIRTVRSFAAERCEIAGYRDRLRVTYSLNKNQIFAYSGYIIVNQVCFSTSTLARLYYMDYWFPSDLPICIVFFSFC